MKKTVISVCAASLLCGTILSTPRAAIARDAEKAYIIKTAISIVLIIVGFISMYLRYWGTAAVPAGESPLNAWSWLNYAGAIANLANAGVTQWMDESGKIMAKFTGTDGYVTDKWVGPPDINKTVETVDNFNADVAKFDVQIPVVELDEAYANLSNPEAADARALAEARRELILARNRSNTGDN